jgi:hypothetical protein
MPFMTQHVIQYDTLLPISETLVDNLVTLAKAYAEATGVKLTTVGTNSTKTASFYVDLERGYRCDRDGRRLSGEASCTLRKYDLLTAWFSENWPEGHVMPTLKDPHHYPPTPEGPSPDVKDPEVRSKAKSREETRSRKSPVKKSGGKQKRSGAGKGHRA